MCTFTYIIDLYLIHTRTLSLGFQSILFIFLPLLILYIETTCGAVKMFSNRSFVLYWKRYISTVKYMCTWMNFLFFFVYFLQFVFLYMQRRIAKNEKVREVNWVSTESTRLLDTCECVSVIHLFAITLHKVFILPCYTDFFFYTLHHILTYGIILNVRLAYSWKDLCIDRYINFII